MIKCLSHVIVNARVHERKGEALEQCQDPAPVHQSPPYEDNCAVRVAFAYKRRKSPNVPILMYDNELKSYNEFSNLARSQDLSGCKRYTNHTPLQVREPQAFHSFVRTRDLESTSFGRFSPPYNLTTHTHTRTFISLVLFSMSVFHSGTYRFGIIGCRREKEGRCWIMWDFSGLENVKYKASSSSIRHALFARIRHKS